MATVVRVDTFEPPTLITYRMEDSATWQTPRTISPNVFELTVTGPYRITVVCTEPEFGIVGIWQAALAPDDPAPSDVLSCFTPPGRYLVAGTMAQPGSVALELTTAKSAQASWPFELKVNANTYALIARTDERIAIQRGLRVADDVTLEAPIDVDASGTPLDRVALSVTNLDAAETRIAARVSLEADHTYTTLYRGALDETVLAPQSVLEDADEQLVVVSASGSGRSRYVQRPLRAGDPTAFTLPPALGPVTFAVDGEQLSAAWSTLPAYDFVEVTLDAFVEDEVRTHILTLSRAFIEATNITSATIDTSSLPGAHPKWRIDTNQQHTRMAAVHRKASATELTGSSVSETANAPNEPVDRATGAISMPMPDALLPSGARRRQLPSW